MRCKTCDDLLELYERSVKLYAHITHKLSGALGSDFMHTYEMAERAKATCQLACDNLMDHWRSVHKPPPKVSWN